MRCGLFGKLPAKRDFIAVGAPRAFLRVWEPWLEQGLAEARGRASEEDFAAAYNTAPIWRFWLGPALCGKAFVGAFMPSVDALGRMFPLTLIGASAEGDTLEPPDVDPREEWFAAAESLLLDALDLNASLEALVTRLDEIRASAAIAPGSKAAQQESALTLMFGAMRLEQPGCRDAAATFWWTVGGGECPALAMMRQSMPTSATFAEMLRPRQDGDENAEKESPPQASAQTG